MGIYHDSTTTKGVKVSKIIIEEDDKEWQYSKNEIEWEYTGDDSLEKLRERYEFEQLFEIITVYSYAVLLGNTLHYKSIDKLKTKEELQSIFVNLNKPKITYRIDKVYKYRVELDCKTYTTYKPNSESFYSWYTVIDNNAREITPEDKNIIKYILGYNT